MNFVDVVDENGVRGSKKLPEGFKNYLIDIDGTICDDIPNEEPEKMPGAKEFLGAKDKINKWYEEGHIITFFTARGESTRDITEKWLKDHGFNYHTIIFDKPRGGNYHWIDDRDVECTKFSGWKNL